MFRQMWSKCFILWKKEGRKCLFWPTHRSRLLMVACAISSRYCFILWEKNKFQWYAIRNFLRLRVVTMSNFVSLIATSKKEMCTSTILNHIGVRSAPWLRNWFIIDSLLPQAPTKIHNLLTDWSPSTLARVATIVSGRARTNNLVTHPWPPTSEPLAAVYTCHSSKPHDNIQETSVVLRNRKQVMGRIGEICSKLWSRCPINRTSTSLKDLSGLAPTIFRNVVFILHVFILVAGFRNDISCVTTR